MRLIPRVAFALLAAAALGTVLGSCTHRGTPSPIPSVTQAPTQRTVYVNAKTGSDTGNGSQATPYKTVTRALKAVASPGPIPVLDIEIANGDYNTANGEVFPLVVPSVAGLVINGSTYGSRGPSKGAYIDGAGEDTVYEKAVSAAPGSYYTTIAISVGAQVSMSSLYVGTSHPALPGLATYDSIDLLGQLTGTTTSFNAPVTRGAFRENGVLVGGGTFSCASCAVAGKQYAIAAFAIPGTQCGGSSSSSGSGGGSCPTLTLTGPSNSGQGSIAGLVGITTDGSAAVTVSNQTFSGEATAFTDTYKPFLTGIVPVSADFGQGLGSPPSTGGNIFLGARVSAIALTLAGDAVDAYGNTWNQRIQGTDASGQFRSEIIFDPGASGTNVTIASAATGAKVRVGPFKHATPTPSASPSGSPSGSPSASPTASPT